jgi:phage-related protein
MHWSVELLNETVEKGLTSLPEDMQARYLRISDLLETHGPQVVGMPHVRPLRNKLWEMRLKGKDGIARAIYFAASGRRLIVVRIFQKKSERTPNKELSIAEKRMKQL